ncbi:MAG: TolC family protein [Acidobacteria bacterium]|nr:TolC family protein [Acidobacteriota bacterium]MBI3663051.1 TolC family protein [Acidobacteriota bacterium]
MRVRLLLLLSITMILGAGGVSRAQEPPAVSPAEPPAASAPPVRLGELVAEAERNHPSIQAAARMVGAKRARIAQARALPDPQLSAGYMGSLAPFKTQKNDPSSYRTLGVMQEIPYPGKRDLRGKIAAKEADAEIPNVEAARRRVRAEVKLAYYELWGVGKALEITGKNKELLEKLARIAEERYKLGKGLQQDVLRAQVEVTRIRQRQTLLEQRRRTLEAQIASLLLRSADTPLGPLPAEMAKSGLPYSFEELIGKGVENSPEIRRQEQLIEQSRLATDLARKEFYPDFSVSWDYQNRTSGMPEMYGLRFTMNLPFFNKGRRYAAVNEASETQASARQMREAVRTALVFQVKEQFLAARASDELLTLYSKAIVPQSALALESSLTAYQVGALDFLSMLTNFITVLDYETSYYEELARYQQALARLEELTGIDLDGASGSAQEEGKP